MNGTDDGRISLKDFFQAGFDRIDDRQRERDIQLDRRLTEILTQVTRTNGRVDKTEDDIIRLQVAASNTQSPWTAGSVLSALAVGLYAAWEKYSK